MKKRWIYGLLITAAVLAFGITMVACDSGGDDGERYEPFVIRGTVAGRTTELEISTNRTVPRTVLTPASGDSYVLRYINPTEVISQGTIQVDPNGVMIRFNPSGGGQSFSGSFSGGLITIPSIPGPGGTTLSFTPAGGGTTPGGGNGGTTTGTDTGTTRQAGAAVNSGWTASFDTKTNTTIVLDGSDASLSTDTGQDIEYALSTSDTIPPTTGFRGTLPATFTGLTPATEYFAWARSAQNSGYNAGTPAVLGNGSETTLMAEGLNVTVAGSGTAGVNIPVTLTIADANGAVDTTFDQANVTVTVTNSSRVSPIGTIGRFGAVDFNDTTGIATVTNQAFTNGVATVNLILHAPVANTVTFAVAGVQPTTVSRTITIAVGAVAKVIIDTHADDGGDEQLTDGILTFDTQPVVKVLDAFENPIEDETVTASIDNATITGGGVGKSITITGTVTATTDSDGLATFDDLGVDVDTDSETVTKIVFDLIFTADSESDEQNFEWGS